MSFENFLKVVADTSTTGLSSVRVDRFVEARASSVSEAGLYFTIPEWDGGRHAFGPAPWVASRVEGGTPSTPASGDRILVLFLGGDVAHPWVLGWWPL